MLGVELRHEGVHPAARGVLDDAPRGTRRSTRPGRSAAPCGPSPPRRHRAASPRCAAPRPRARTGRRRRAGTSWPWSGPCRRPGGAAGPGRWRSPRPGRRRRSSPRGFPGSWSTSVRVDVPDVHVHGSTHAGQSSDVARVARLRVSACLRFQTSCAGAARRCLSRRSAGPPRRRERRRFRGRCRAGGGDGPRRRAPRRRARRGRPSTPTRPGPRAESAAAAGLRARAARGRGRAPPRRRHPQASLGVQLAQLDRPQPRLEADVPPDVGVVAQVRRPERAGLERSRGTRPSSRSARRHAAAG